MESSLANNMKSVNSSESAHRDARGIKDRASLRKALDDIERAREAVVARKSQIQIRLIELRERVRAPLPQSDYRALCDEQSQLKAELVKLEAKLHELKIERMSIESDFRNLGEGDMTARGGATALLKRILSELMDLHATIKARQG